MLTGYKLHHNCTRTAPLVRRAVRRHGNGDNWPTVLRPKTPWTADAVMSMSIGKLTVRSVAAAIEAETGGALAMTRMSHDELATAMQEDRIADIPGHQIAPAIARL